MCVCVCVCVSVCVCACACVCVCVCVRVAIHYHVDAQYYINAREINRGPYRSEGADHRALARSRDYYYVYNQARGARPHCRTATQLAMES